MPLGHQWMSLRNKSQNFWSGPRMSNVSGRAPAWANHFQKWRSRCPWSTGFLSGWYCFFKYFVLTLARTGGGVGATPPPWGFSRIAKKTAARSAAGFWATLWGKPCAIFGKKNWPGQVRSRSYDVIRGTTSGNFSNKVVFSRNFPWRHWCKW